MRRFILVAVEFTLLLGNSHFNWIDRARGNDTDQAKGVQPPQNNPQVSPPQSIPGQPGYFGYTQTPWFGSPAIQKQLNLTNEQMNQLNNAYGQHWSQYSKGLGNLNTLNEQQRAQKMQELTNGFNSQLGQRVQGLLKPEQYQRYQQLNWQHQGLNAFTDPNVQGRLKLSPAQVQRIEAIRNEQAKNLSNIQAQTATDPATAAKEFQNLRDQNQAQLNAILNPQQQQMWRQLVGEPYDFTPEGYRIQKK